MKSKKKMVLSCYYFSLMFFIGLALFPTYGGCMQGLSPPGPVGATDVNQAISAPPGLYGGIVYGYLNYKDWYFEDDSTPIDDGTHFAGIGLAYSYDFKVFGGSVMSTISGGFQTVKFRYNDSSLNPSGEFSEYDGLMDVYTDLFFWTRFFPSKEFASQPKGSFIPYGLGIGTGLGVTWPVGTNDENEALNVGANIYTISPSVAMTWTIPSLLGKTLGDATQFSARVFYNYFTEDKDRHMQNGTLLSVDSAITQIKGPWQYGIALYVYKQLTDDELTYPRNDFRTATKTENVFGGPMVQYTFMAGGRMFVAKVRGSIGIHARNGADAPGITCALSTKF